MNTAGSDEQVARTETQDQALSKRQRSGSRDRFSRRDVLVKGAAAGAAGVAAVTLGRPLMAEATYAITGGTVNNADAQTTLLALSTFVTGSALLKADGNLGSNGATNIDGVQAIATGTGVGVTGIGGNNYGTGVRGVGGNVASANSTYSGTGVFGRGADALSGPGVVGQGGTGSGAGVIGIGSATPTSSIGVIGMGQGFGSGGSFQGGSSSGTGLGATGGLPNGVGISAGGSGTSAGILGFGGSSGGTGIQGQAGGSNGVGVLGLGAGTGSGVIGLAGSGTIGPGVTGTGGALGVGGVFGGGRAAIALIPASTAGPATSGGHAKGDVWVDSTGIPWVCLVAGTPGTFAPLQVGGLNTGHFVAASTRQYSLANSDGVTWVDMDAANLVLTIAPGFRCQAILSGNAALWTANAGFNQDIGIFISGGSYGAGQIVAWNESGGFAGTFSPNAAFVETTQPLASGVTYTIKLQWKTNKPATGATIFAGAGPIPASSTTFSPTRLAGSLIVSS